MARDTRFVNGEYYAVSLRSSGDFAFYMLVKGWFMSSAYGTSLVKAAVIYDGIEKIDEQRTIQRTWLRNNIVEKITDEAKICELKLRGLVL